MGPDADPPGVPDDGFAGSSNATVTESSLGTENAVTRSSRALSSVEWMEKLEHLDAVDRDGCLTVVWEGRGSGVVW